MSRGHFPCDAAMSSSSAARTLLSAALAFALALSSGRAQGQAVKVAKAPAAKIAKPLAKPLATKRPSIKRHVAKKPARPKTTTVVLYHVNRHDTMTLRLRDAQGRPIKGQQKRFDFGDFQREFIGEWKQLSAWQIT